MAACTSAMSDVVCGQDLAVQKYRSGLSVQCDYDYVHHYALIDQRWSLVGQVGSAHLLTSGGRWWVKLDMCAGENAYDQNLSIRSIWSLRFIVLC